MQRLRGRIYVEDGALQPAQLTPDGRHILSSDLKSWHLLIRQNQEVAGCMRYLAHSGNTPFHELGVASSAPARCSRRGPRIREAVERELRLACKLRVGFGEVGGWAVDNHLRGTSAALRLVLATYNLAQLLGHAIGLSTATVRNGSAMILRRLGGEPLKLDTGELEPYYDPRYNCEMRVLRFDSRRPSPKYKEKIDQCREQFLDTAVFCPTRAMTVAAA